MGQFFSLYAYDIWEDKMYQIPRLPYLYQDLEPYIDTHTVGLHYHKHHYNYLNKLNELLEKNNYDYRYELDELPYHINEFPTSDRTDILFNLGGVLNHNLYWKSMNPRKDYKPTGQLKEHIEKTFGSYKKFLDLFKEMALKLKGSGYTFLVLNRDGGLEIINVMNQDLPILYGYMPLFNIDMWEHAYYLNYENDKSKYIDNFISVADFRNASKIFNNIIK